MMKKTAQRMRKIWKQKALPVSGKLFYVLIIAFFHIHGQSFSGSNIYIEKETLVYIQDGVKLYGLGESGHTAEDSITAARGTTGLLLPVHKKNSKKNDVSVKRSEKTDHVRKQVDTTAFKAISSPLSESRYRLGLFDNNAGVMLVTGNPSVKYTALHTRQSFEKYIRIREEERVSYGTACGPFSGILIIHFSRPPPFKSIV